MGVVYHAHDPTLGRDVALKVLLGGRRIDEKRFLVEAQAACRLRHPNIVRTHELGQHHGHPFIVMDFVRGESLQARLSHQGPLAPAAAARLTATLARALAHAHAHDVLHRDLKPENVLLVDETPLLTDFGVARIGDGRIIAGQVAAQDRCIGGGIALAACRLRAGEAATRHDEARVAPERVPRDTDPVRIDRAFEKIPRFRVEGEKFVDQKADVDGPIPKAAA